MKLWGKCCVDVAFVGICPAPPGDLPRISTPMWTGCQSRHLQHIPCIQGVWPFWAFPEHFCDASDATDASGSGIPWKHKLGWQQAQQSRCTLSLSKRGSASHSSGALQTSCGGGGFNSRKCWALQKHVKLGVSQPRMGGVMGIANDFL